MFVSRSLSSFDSMIIRFNAVHSIFDERFHSIMRRKIGIKEIEDMALGATVLGAGGGGDPYVGKLMAIEAIKKYGEVELISPDEVPDDAVVCVSQMMGAPTIMVEKICSGLEPMATYDELVKELQTYVKKQTAPYKYPRIVEFVTELPKTISGKIRRTEIRDRDSRK